MPDISIRYPLRNDGTDHHEGGVRGFRGDVEGITCGTCGKWVSLDDFHTCTPEPSDDILTEAKRLIEGPRREDYDLPEKNLQQTADLWNAYLTRKLATPVTATDVALCMTLVKLSRESFRHTSDNLIDAIGYIACADRIAREGEDI